MYVMHILLNNKIKTKIYCDQKSQRIPPLPILVFYCALSALGISQDELIPICKSYIQVKLHRNPLIS